MKKLNEIHANQIQDKNEKKLFEQTVIDKINELAKPPKIINFDTHFLKIQSHDLDKYLCNASNMNYFKILALINDNTNLDSLERRSKIEKMVSSIDWNVVIDFDRTSCNNEHALHGQIKNLLKLRNRDIENDRLNDI